MIRQFCLRGKESETCISVILTLSDQSVKLSRIDQCLVCGSEVVVELMHALKTNNHVICTCSIPSDMWKQGASMLSLYVKTSLSAKTFNIHIFKTIV